MHIRIAHTDDAVSLSTIAKQAFNETFHHYTPEALAEFFANHYSADVFASYIQDKHTQLWVVEDAGQPIGYAKSGACALPGTPDVFPAIELHRLYVLKKWQKRKIGAALMEKFFGAADSQGAKAAYLGVWSGNTNAHQFYAKYGFVKVGEYNYLPIGKVVDREWIMRRSL